MRPSDASTSTSWSARRASACSANQRNPLAHLAASPLAWANGFPVSVVTTWAMSGSSPSNSSAAVISKRDRSANVLVAQSDAAATATARRDSTVAASYGSKDSSSSPLVGLTVASGGPESTGLIRSVFPTFPVLHAGPDAGRPAFPGPTGGGASCGTAPGHRSAPTEEIGDPVPLHLAGGRPGEDVDHLVLLGPLVAGQSGLGEVLHRLHQAPAVTSVDRGTRRGGHQGGAHPLAPAVIGKPEDGDFAHALRLDQDRLHLCRVDVDPPGDDQVVPTPVEEEVAIVVEPPQIPDGECPVPPGRRRLGLVPPVGEAGESGGTAPDRAVPVHREGPVGTGPADGARTGRPLVGRARGELALGRPVDCLLYTSDAADEEDSV